MSVIHNDSTTQQKLLLYSCYLGGKAGCGAGGGGGLRGALQLL